MPGACAQREWTVLNRAADAAKGTEPPLRRAMHGGWDLLEKHGGLHPVQKERRIISTVKPGTGRSFGVSEAALAANAPVQEDVQAVHQKKGVQS